MHSPLPQRGSGPPGPSDPPTVAWTTGEAVERVDNMVLWFGLPIIAAHIALGATSAASAWLTVELAMTPALLALILFGRRALPVHARAVGHIAWIAAFAVVTLLHHGPGLEAAALFVVAGVGSAILIGRSGLLVVSAATAVALTIVALADPHGLPVEGWVRGTLVIIGTSLVLGHLLTAMLARVNASHAAAQAALERERAERLAHAEAERELARSWRLEAVARLAHGVAHEVNNALTVVLGNAAVLRERADSDEVAAMLDDSIAAGEGARATVQRLAALNRDDGERGQADVADVVHAVVARLTPELPADVKLTHAVHTTRIAAIPRNDLDRVLVALLQNAWESMPGGGTIALEVDEDARRDVVITVRDEGCGMPPERCERAFEPFFTTKPEGAGAGLGLTWAYAAVHHAGGAIALDSEEGVGTVARVTLPHRGPGWDSPVF